MEKDIKKEEEKAISLALDVISIKITSQPKLEEAKTFLASVKEWKKALKTKKEAITKPLNEGLRKAREMFKPTEEKLDNAERMVKGKISDYLVLLEKEEQEKKVEIEAKVESGEMKMETAGNKLEKVAEKKEAIRKRVIKEIHIVDKSKVPLEYLLIDTVAVRRDMMAGKSIAGIEFRDKTVII